MRFAYVSASVLPSRAANAVHVALQCDALARAGADLTLYAKRAMGDPARLPEALHAAYGVDASEWRLATYHVGPGRGHTPVTAAMACADLLRRREPGAIFSRNLYAAYVLAVIARKPLICEMHDVERGFRRALQRAIVRTPWVTTVAISEALIDHLVSAGMRPARPHVLHDAAPAGMERLGPGGPTPRLDAVTPPGSWAARCAYFGHLYAGRGIEIIEGMASARPAVLFVIFGGNDSDVAARRAANCRPNLVFAGHRPHVEARVTMREADVLLMPYQASVSLGVEGRDTARWMSPMKMFEYLGAGRPIISSDLPVLREVLRHEVNALLAPPADVEAWIAALDRLVADPGLAMRLGETGHAEYLSRHTWDARARALLALAQSGDT